MTHRAPKLLTSYVTMMSTHSVMSVLVMLIDAAVNLFRFFPMNLLWEIFLCYLVAVYIWPFPSKCIYENTVFLFTPNRKKFALRRKCLIRFRSPVLLITVLQRYMRVWCSVKVRVNEQNLFSVTAVFRGKKWKKKVCCCCLSVRQ